MIEDLNAFSGIFPIILKLFILFSFTFILKLKPKIYNNFEDSEDIIANFDINKKIISDQYKEARSILSEIKKMNLQEDPEILIYKSKLEEFCFLIEKVCYLPEFNLCNPKDIISKIRKNHENFLK